MEQNDEIKFHLKTAKSCFNEAWDYLDKKNRNHNDDQQMLHLAHTSRYHWSLVERDETKMAKRLATGDWQISRIYAALHEPQLALHFAQSALRIMQENSLFEILHSGYEGVARAFAIGRDSESASKYIKKAREQLSRAVGLDDEDRATYLEQIRETELLMDR